MSSVISYTLHNCQRCLKCLQVCPTQAIVKQHDRVQIKHKNCINCGRCIQMCHNQGLHAKGSTLNDIENYDYSAVLIPSSIYGLCRNIDDVRHLYGALRQLGFEEIVDLSDIEGALLNKAVDAAQNSDELVILSKCSSTIGLIEQQYPTLYNQVLWLNDASEIAARRLRKKHAGQHIGIFLLCECAAHLAEAKYPYGKKDSEVDHALSVVDLFPKISAMKEFFPEDVQLCPQGLISSSVQLMKEHLPSWVMIPHGQEQLTTALELAEFNQLFDYKMMIPLSCFNGCLGGRLLWGNPFSSESSVVHLLNSANKPCSGLSEEEWFLQAPEIKRENGGSFKERIHRFNRLNEIMEQLPGFNCGACGFANCRVMAEEILEGTRNIHDCKISEAMKG